MPVKKTSTQLEHARRVRHLIALDASAVMLRLINRIDEMIALFSRARNRTPMLETTDAWFFSITFGDLAALTAVEQRAVNAFYAQLSELRWYLSYTEDMPSSLREKVLLRLKQLETAHRVLVQAIGAPEGDGFAVVQATAKTTALARPRTRRNR